MHLYILKSQKNSKYYIGVSNDISKRLLEHNAGKEKSTKSYLPWNLVYFEEFPSKSEAMKKEKYIKSQKSHIWIDNYIEIGSVAQR